MSPQADISRLAPGQNSDRYRAFFDSVPEAVFFVSPVGEILEANPACISWFAQQQKVCIGANVHDLMASHHSFHQNHQFELKAVVDEVLHTGKRLLFEGEEHTGIPTLSISPVFSPEGEVVELCLVHQDDTAQKRAETKCRDTQSQFDFALEKCQLGLWSIDLRDGSINHTLGHDRIFGYQSLLPEWNFECYRKHVIPEDLGKIDALYQDIMDHLASWSVEYRIRRADGAVRWLQDIGGCERDETGKPIRILGVTRDIHDQKQLSQEQQLLQSQWDFALYKNQIGLWKMDLDSLIVLKTSTHTDIFGYGTDAVQWSLQKFFSHIVSDDRAEVERMVREAIDKHNDLGFECRISRKGGDIRWINIAGVFQHDQGGGSPHLLGIIQDITDRKAQEAEFGKLEAKLQQSQKMDLVGQLAGGIAHDFNNVLSVILGATDFAMEQIDDAHPLFEHFDTIRHSVNRSAEMVKQLLAFARMQPWMPEVVDVDAEMHKIRLMLSKLIRENSALRWNLHAHKATVSIDPSNLVQIITNLCINSRDAISGEGLITIQTDVVRATDCEDLAAGELQGAGDVVRISVADNGCGIDQQTLPHVFEPFFTTKQFGKGTGLGLSMVYGLVKQNGGAITCQSEVAKGTTFSIFLPVSQNPVTTRELSAAELPAKSHKDVVLLVEDEPGILKIISSALKRKGFTVETASNAEDAIKMCQDHGDGISLVISDVMMPGMNGIQMSKRLQKMHPLMKFILMSGYSADSFNLKDLVAEKTSFISKPFRITELVKLVDSVHAVKPVTVT